MRTLTALILALAGCQPAPEAHHVLLNLLDSPICTLETAPCDGETWTPLTLADPLAPGERLPLPRAACQDVFVTSCDRSFIGVVAVVEEEAAVEAARTQPSLVAVW